jgi:hypothetical protein
MAGGMHRNPLAAFRAGCKISCVKQTFAREVLKRFITLRRLGIRGLLFRCGFLGHSEFIKIKLGQFIPKLIYWQIFLVSSEECDPNEAKATKGRPAAK